MASTTKPNAAQRLNALRAMRLRGQAPTGALCVATDRADVALFEEIRRPVIEVWRRDAGSLDWAPIAGLWVCVVVRNWPHETRLELFDAIRAGAPHRLDWLATTGSRIVGRLQLVDGEPVELWETPELSVSDPPEGRPRGKAGQGGWYSYGRV